MFFFYASEVRIVTYSRLGLGSMGYGGLIKGYDGEFRRDLLDVENWCLIKVMWSEFI